MEANDNSKIEAVESVVNEKEAPSESPVSTDRTELKRKRITDYLDAGLAKEAPSEACLAAVSADLMGIGSELGRALNEALATGSPTAESLRHMAPVLNDLLKVTRQIDRLMNLELRTAEARMREAEAKTKLKMMALQGNLDDIAGLQGRSPRGQW